MTRADAHIAKARSLQDRLQILGIENVCKQTSGNVRFNMDDSGLRGVDTEQVLQITRVVSTNSCFRILYICHSESYSRPSSIVPPFMAINTSFELEVPDDMGDTGVSQLYKGRFSLDV